VSPKAPHGAFFISIFFYIQKNAWYANEFKVRNR
jgi:hypothetical protein